MNYNPNDLLNKFRESKYTPGYKLGDKEEFGFVRKGLLEYGLSSKNFDENLKSLVIAKDSDGIGYNSKSNTINGVDRGVDLVHELFHMSSNINNGSVEHGAYSKHGYGKSLNEGFVEHLIFLTNTQNYNARYPIEEIVVEMLNILYDDTDLLQAFVAGNPDKFYDTFGKDKNTVISLVKLLDNYTNNIILSRDIMLSSHYKGNKINDIGKCYDTAYESLLTFITKFYSFYSQRDKSRLMSFINDIEDALYNYCESDIVASKYEDFNNYVKQIEHNIRSVERGV